MPFCIAERQHIIGSACDATVSSKGSQRLTGPNTAHSVSGKATYNNRGVELEVISLFSYLKKDSFAQSDFSSIWERNIYKQRVQRYVEIKQTKT